MLHGHDKIGMLELHDINIPFVSCINKCHFKVVFKFQLPQTKIILID